MLARCARNIGQHLNKLVFASRYNFEPTPEFQLIDKYLRNNHTSIYLNNNPTFKFECVAVPRTLEDFEQVKAKLQGDWKNKKLVFDVDTAGLVGSKRLTMRSYLQETVLKGQTKPDPIFCEINPAAELNIQQLQFDDEVFFLSDPIVTQFLSQKANLQEKEQQQALQQFLSDYYESNPNHMCNRLGSVLNISQPYRKLVELSVVNFNQVYFCGFNQFAFRNLLSKILTLKDAQQLFMMSLKYALVSTYQWKLSQQQKNQNNPIPKQPKNINDRPQRLQDRYEIYARELIYLNYYNKIKKIENGEILKRISVIQKQRTRTDEIGRNVRRKTNKEEKIDGGVVLFAHSYTLDSLQDYILIKDLEVFNPVENTPKISTLNLNSVGQGSKPKPKKSTQTDAQKIEKHAIFQVMLGNLWNKPYAFNKFPYLSENYHKISEQDKIEVNSLYQNYVVKYSGAKRVFYRENVEQLENSDLSAVKIDMEKLRVSYDEARKNYEEGVEFMKKKAEIKEAQEKEKVEKKKKKSKKNQENEEKEQKVKEQIRYQETYEEDPKQLEKLIEALKKEQPSKPAEPASPPLKRGPFGLRKIQTPQSSEPSSPSSSAPPRKGRSIRRKPTTEQPTESK